MNAPLAEFSDYESLRAALNACREKRDISFERMDEITGAPPGYFAKLLGPRRVRRIGLQSLGWAFGGLGIKCVIIDDPEALKLVQSRFVERDKPHLSSVMQGGGLHITLSRRHHTIISRKGGRSCWAKLTPRQRTMKAKRMAKSRWRKVRQRAMQRRATHKARKQCST